MCGGHALLTNRANNSRNGPKSGNECRGNREKSFSDGECLPDDRKNLLLQKVLLVGGGGHKIHGGGGEVHFSKQVILYRGIIYLCCLHLSNLSWSMCTDHFKKN